MKKVLLTLGLVLLAAVAWATPDRVLPIEYTGSQQITTRPTTVYGVNVSYIGVIAGQNVQLIDGLGGSGASCTTRFTCIAATTAGTCVAPYTQSSAYFGTALYYQENKSQGTFKTDIQAF